MFVEGTFTNFIVSFLGTFEIKLGGKLNHFPNICFKIIQKSNHTRSEILVCTLDKHYVRIFFLDQIQSQATNMENGSNYGTGKGLRIKYF